MTICTWKSWVRCLGFGRLGLLTKRSPPSTDPGGCRTVAASVGSSRTPSHQDDYCSMRPAILSISSSEHASRALEVSPAAKGLVVGTAVCLSFAAEGQAASAARRKQRLRRCTTGPCRIVAAPSCAGTAGVTGGGEPTDR